MITQIDTEIVTETKEEADVLDAALSAAGADTSVGRQHGRWTVFARYDQNDAAHVGRAILGA